MHIEKLWKDTRIKCWLIYYIRFFVPFKYIHLKQNTSLCLWSALMAFEQRGGFFIVPCLHNTGLRFIRSHPKERPLFVALYAGLSYNCKFWFYCVGVNTRFTIWQFGLTPTQYSKFTIWHESRKGYMTL